MGLPVDVNDEEEDFSDYKLVIAPMMYMSKAGVADRLKKFVKDGGNVVFTYATGWVNENDLCYLGGFPGDGLMELSGIWAEELDPLYPSDKNSITMTDGRKYECFGMCEIIHKKSDSVKILATYDDDFYKDMPAVTENTYGAGKCYYIAARTENAFMDDFYGELVNKLNIEKPMAETIPEGVSIETRYGDGEQYYFIMNFNNEEKSVKLTCSAVDILTGKALEKDVDLSPFGYRILKIEG
jgi:beta-galactosidase